MNDMYINEFIGHMAALLHTKNEEYSTREDKWYNFSYGANALGTSEEGAAWAYMAKHLASVSKMVKNPGAYGRDMWREKLGDIANYCALIYAMRCETEDIEELAKGWCEE